MVVDAVAVVSGGESGLDSSSTGVALASLLSSQVPQYGSSGGLNTNTKNNEVGVGSTRMQKEAVLIDGSTSEASFARRQGGRGGGLLVLD